jgi:hypothetical protein
MAGCRPKGVDNLGADWPSLKDGAASCDQEDGDSVAKLGARREVNRNKPISS